MKKLIFLLFLALTAGFSSQAQMGRYGIYDSGRSSLPRGPEVPAKEEEPKTAEELVAAEMPKITEALELNDFEQAVVSSVLTKYTQKRIELQLLQLPKDDAMAAYEEQKAWRASAATALTPGLTAYLEGIAETVGARQQPQLTYSGRGVCTHDGGRDCCRRGHRPGHR